MTKTKILLSSALHLWLTMQFIFSVKISFFLVCGPEKDTHFKSQFNLNKKRGNLFWYISISLFWWATCACEGHENYFFRIYIFIAPRGSKETTVNCVTFVTGVEPISCCWLRPWSILDNNKVSCNSQPYCLQSGMIKFKYLFLTN